MLSRKSVSLALTVLFVLALASACAAPTAKPTPTAEPTHALQAAASGHGEVHWSYEGEGAPNAAKLLPAVQTAYRYNGSLTTPPCTEGVNWFVMTTPVEMSKAQLEAFSKIYNGNNRPLQTLNGRPLIEDNTP